MKQNLYVWNWVGEGYNQTNATSKADALAKAKIIWPSGAVNPSTLRCLNAEEERAYWKNFPLMD
jgi:hypothetical protein